MFLGLVSLWIKKNIKLINSLICFTINVIYLVLYMSNDIYLQVHCSLRLFSFPLFILLTLLPEESPEAPGTDEWGETENSWEILVTFIKWPIRHWNEDKVKSEKTWMKWSEVIFSKNIQNFALFIYLRLICFVKWSNSPCSIWLLLMVVIPCCLYMDLCCTVCQSHHWSVWPDREVMGSHLLITAHSTRMNTANVYCNITQMIT